MIEFINKNQNLRRVLIDSGSDFMSVELSIMEYKFNLISKHFRYTRLKEL
jgi:hypothetical protein